MTRSSRALAAEYERLMAGVAYGGVPWARLTEAQKETVLSAWEAVAELYHRVRDAMREVQERDDGD